MRLRGTIFFWTLLATGLPLLALTFVLLNWGEQRYLHEMDSDMGRRLNALASEIDNRLSYERDDSRHRPIQRHAGFSARGTRRQ